MTTVTIGAHLVPVADIVTLSSSTDLSEEQRAALNAKRMQALSDPTRLRALRILAEAPANTVSVKALTKLLGLTQSCVSRHIERLVLAGFLECVESRGRGVDVKHYYHVKRSAIREALNELLSYTRITEPAMTS